MISSTNISSKIPLMVLMSAYTHNMVQAQQEQISPTEAPNIVFILTDDQRWDALGYAGNDIIQTPNMDKLAAEGIYFKNAFVSTPISAASRASIMTGLYERAHQYTFMQPPVSEELIKQSYFNLLKQAGYYNGYFGKFGVWFKNRLDTTLFDEYKPYKTDFYYRLTHNNTKHEHLTDIMEQHAVDFIKDAPTDRPFCLTVSYNAPHAEDRSPEQYIWPKRLDTLYEDITIPAPIMSEEKYFKAQPPYIQDGLNRVRWHWRYDTPEKYQKMIKGYYRMITAVDQTIGSIQKALYVKGVAQNTIIILIGDNGYFLGERQFAGKWLMYEQSLRVPLLIYDPRNKQHRDVDDLVLNVDIAPTILGYAGVEIPDHYQGLDLSSYSLNKNPAYSREFFLCEHLWDFDPIPASEGIRTKQYKYFR